MIETLRRILFKNTSKYDPDNVDSKGRRGLSSSHYFMIWAMWLLIGTLVYGYAVSKAELEEIEVADEVTGQFAVLKSRFRNLGFAKGFYHAVNIGYSIGWGYPSEEYFENYIWFSSAYVIVGASLVAVALGFFADKIVEDADNWFTNLLQHEEYKLNVSKEKPIHTRILAWMKFNIETVRAISLWIIWILLMIMYSMVQVGWSFREAQYFAISSCSTGGHWGIPNDSPNWLFGVTGFFSALGVPIMGVAMASIATMIIDTGNIDDIKSTIEAKVTHEELSMMRKFNLENDDGVIDRAEYIILCMVRMGTDPQIIQFVSERFNKLDIDGGGTLDIKEILEEHHNPNENEEGGGDVPTTTISSTASPSMSEHKDLTIGDGGGSSKPSDDKDNDLTIKV